MPIAPKYTWWEDADSVHIRLEGAPVKDQQQVFCGDCVVKVNAAPYFLQLDLHDEVDEDASTAAIDRQSVLLALHKKQPVMWGRLTAQGDKASLQARREASVQRAYAKQAAAHQRRLEGKQQEERCAVERRIEVDKRKRQHIQAAKEAELNAERGALSDWQQQLAAGGAPAAGQAWQQQPHTLIRELQQGDESDYEEEEEDSQREADQPQAAAGAQLAAPRAPAAGARQDDHPAYYGRGWRSGVVAAADDGSDDDDDGGSSSSGADACDGDEQEARVPAAAAAAAPAAPLLPPAPPRARAPAVPVTFTPTESQDLPAREGREEELRQHKRRSAAAAGGDDSQDIGDRQPLFLKDRGDALYAQGNHSGAANAYSRALELDPSLAAAWANRAACHLKLAQHGACEADCDAALALLQPQLDKLSAGGEGGEAAQRLAPQVVRALARRAAARVALGRLEGAEEDLGAATRLAPGNAQLAADLAEVVAARAPADPALLRQRAGARFAAGDYEGAAEAFGALLGVEGASAQDCVAALGNRAACWLPLQQYERCASDCRAALELLVGGGAGQPPAHAGPAAACTPGVEDPGCSTAGDVCGRVEAAVPAWASEQQRAAGRLLARLGAACCYRKQYPAAERAYCLSQQLCRQLGEGERAEQLAADLQRVVDLAGAAAGACEAAGGAA